MLPLVALALWELKPNKVVDDFEQMRQDLLAKLVSGEVQIPQAFVQDYIQRLINSLPPQPVKTKTVYETVIEPTTTKKGLEVFGKEIIPMSTLEKLPQALVKALDKVKVGKGSSLADLGYYFSRRFAKGDEKDAVNQLVDVMDKSGRYFRSTHDKRIAAVKEMIKDLNKRYKLDNDASALLGVLVELEDSALTPENISRIANMMQKQGLIKQVKDLPPEVRERVAPLMREIAEQELEHEVLDKLRKEYYISHLVKPKKASGGSYFDFADDFGKGIFAEAPANPVGSPTHQFTNRRTFKRMLDVLEANNAKYHNALDEGATHEEALAQMLFDIKTTDIFKILGIRSEASRKALTNKKLIDTITSSPEYFSLTPKEGWKLVSFKGGKTGYIPDWLHRRLSIDLADQPGFFRVMDKVTSPWRALVTSLRPDFIMRNALDNAFKTKVFGDVGLKDFAKQFKKSYQGPVTVRDFVLDESGKWKYTPGAVNTYNSLTQTQLKDLEDFLGINFTGFYGRSGDLVGDVEKFLDIYTRPYKPGNILKRIVEGARSANESVENAFKRAQFMKFLEQFGGDVDKAAKGTNKLLFDYGDITGFERNILRSMMPFYTFRRKNIPLMLEKFVTSPGRVYPLLHAANVGNQYNDELPRELKPDMLKHSYNIALGNGKYFVPGFSITDPDAVIPFSDQPLTYPMLNPIIQAAITGMTGKTAVGQDLEEKSGYAYKTIPPLFAKALEALGADVRKIEDRYVLPAKQAYLLNLLTPGILSSIGRMEVPGASLVKTVDPVLALQIYLSNENKRLDDLISANKLTGKYIPSKKEYEMLGIGIDSQPANLPKPLLEALRKAKKGE